jgi:hypothetical protein
MGFTGLQPVAGPALATLCLQNTYLASIFSGGQPTTSWRIREIWDSRQMIGWWSSQYYSYRSTPAHGGSTSQPSHDRTIPVQVRHHMQYPGTLRSALPPMCWWSDKDLLVENPIMVLYASVLANLSSKRYTYFEQSVLKSR